MEMLISTKILVYVEVGFELKKSRIWGIIIRNADEKIEGIALLYQLLDVVVAGSKVG